MTETPRWNLPLLTQGQAQKEVSHNEALHGIDRILQLAVVTRRLGQPPARAAIGDIFIVGTAPDGSWAGCAGMLASYDGRGWTLTNPRGGCLAWICDEAALTVFHDKNWQTLVSLPPNG